MFCIHFIVGYNISVSQKYCTISLALCYLINFLLGSAHAVSWEEWWTYDGISGESHTELDNP